MRSIKLSYPWRSRTPEPRSNGRKARIRGAAAPQSGSPPLPKGRCDPHVPLIRSFNCTRLVAIGNNPLRPPSKTWAKRRVLSGAWPARNRRSRMRQSVPGTDCFIRSRRRHRRGRDAPHSPGRPVSRERRPPPGRRCNWRRRRVLEARRRGPAGGARSTRLLARGNGGRHSSGRYGSRRRRARPDARRGATGPSWPKPISTIRACQGPRQPADPIRLVDWSRDFRI